MEKGDRVPSRLDVAYSQYSAWCNEVFVSGQRSHLGGIGHLRPATFLTARHSPRAMKEQRQEFGHLAEDTIRRINSPDSLPALVDL